MDTIVSDITMDELFAGTYPVKKRAITLTGGAALKRGTLIGVTTADINLGAIVSDQASNGTEVVEGILIDAADPTGGDVKVSIALTGDFNQAALTVGGNSTVESYQAAMRAKCLFIDKTALPV